MTSRRTHGPPEDLLDDWGSCEFLSSFRQDATATRSVVLPRKGDNSQSVVEASIASVLAPTRSTRSEHPEELVEPM